MTDLPTLEAALFQKELDTITAKLAPLVQGIRDVFGEYGDSDGRIYGNPADLLLISEWMRSLPETSEGYYAGYFLQVRTPELRDLPPLLEKLIREAAIRKHLEGEPKPSRPALPEPMTEAPERGTTYYKPSLDMGCLFDEYVWRGGPVDLKWIGQRLCYRTAEDAITVAKAQLELLNPVKP